MQVNDRIALGVFAAAAATVPQVFLNLVLVRLKLCLYYDYQISSSIYLLKHLTYTVPGFILGGLTWTAMAGSLGIATVYLLSWTGTSYWWLKGMVVSNGIMYTLIYGFFYALGGPKIVPWDLETNLALFADNAVFGLVLGFLITRWGRDLLRH